MRERTYIKVCITILVIALIAVGVFLIYRAIGLREQREQEERERFVLMQEQVIYARRFWLGTRDEDVEDRIVSVNHVVSERRTNPDKEAVRYIVFVHSEEEAMLYADDPTTVAAWPGGDFRYRGLFLLNHFFERAQREDWYQEPIIIPDDITLPITDEDIVERWESVMEIMWSLHHYYWQDVNDAFLGGGWYYERGFFDDLDNAEDAG